MVGEISRASRDRASYSVEPVEANIQCYNFYNNSVPFLLKSRKRCLEEEQHTQLSWGFLKQML